MLNYGGDSHPLKIEISYRRKEIDEREYTTINDIQVYKLNPLDLQKASAYAGRDKIRDLYDMCYLTNYHLEELDQSTLDVMRSVVEHKGLEQCQYLIKTQSDTLIDNEKLENDFLDMHDRLGLINDENNLKTEIEEDLEI